MKKIIVFLVTLASTAIAMDDHHVAAKRSGEADTAEVKRVKIDDVVLTELINSNNIEQCFDFISKKGPDEQAKLYYSLASQACERNWPRNIVKSLIGRINDQLLKNGANVDDALVVASHLIHLAAYFDDEMLLVLFN